MEACLFHEKTVHVKQFACTEFWKCAIVCNTKSFVSIMVGASFVLNVNELKH